MIDKVLTKGEVDLMDLRYFKNQFDKSSSRDQSVRSFYYWWYYYWMLSPMGSL